MAKKKAAKKDTGFAARLRALRESAGLSLRELGERSGLNQFAISRLERGEREPQWSSVLALCAALKVRPNAFMPKG